MARRLEILGLQAAPHAIGTPFAGFAGEARAAMAAHPGVDLLVFPELHLFHPTAATANAELRAAARPAGCDLDLALTALAAELGVWLVPGTLCEAGPAGELFNTARVYGPDGRIHAAYHKVFPWRPSEPYDPGAAWVVFDLPGVGRIGLTICYDMWFPEVTRQVAWLATSSTKSSFDPVPMAPSKSITWICGNAAKRRSISSGSAASKTFSRPWTN